jgi:hypothetical protein
MKRFMPVLLALSFSVIAVAVMLFVVRPRAQVFRDAAGELRHKIDEVIEEVTENEEGDE